MAYRRIDDQGKQRLTEDEFAAAYEERFGQCLSQGGVDDKIIQYASEVFSGKTIEEFFGHLEWIEMNGHS